MRLAVGTAQFGLDYGISNKRGQIPSHEAARVLYTAKRAGLDTLDTAAAYGNSEAVLGTLDTSEFRIVSKIPAFDGSNDASAWVIDNIQRSLTTLNIQQLDGVLLHNSNDILGSQGDLICDGLRAAKQAGLVRKVGYSIYSPSLLPQLLRQLQPDVIQAPLNVFDQRLVQSGWLARLADMGVEIHTRSAFLQGLLLMSAPNRPSYFKPWHKLLSHWDEIVAASKGNALQASLGCIKSHKTISRVVVGVENACHLKQIISAWNTATILNYEALVCNDVLLVNPSHWRL